MMVVLAVVFFGSVALAFIPVDFLPKISVRSLVVSTEYTGISASEMRSMVTVPLEDSLASIKGLKRITSVSREGLSLITIELHWGTDVDMALVECRELIDVNFEKLPSQCKKPVVTKNDASRSDTMAIVLIPRDGDLVYARYIAEKEIKPKLQRIEGTGIVNLEGGEKERIEILVSKERMESRGLTLQKLAQAIESSNFEYPSGTLREGDLELLVKTSGLFRSLPEMSEIPVSYNDGGLVRLSDIAEVRRGIEEKKSFFLYKDKPCIKLGIQKRQDASPVQLSRNVRAEINRLREMYGGYYDFVIVSDDSSAVVDSLKSLIISALVGIIATYLVIRYFFRSRLLALINSSVIPLCGFFSFAVLMLCGRSLNIMSLSGIALGIGMVVDASSVVLENIQRRIRSDGIPRREAIIEATGEVAMSNVGSVLTTVIVFIPVLFMKGIIAELFADMSISIIAAMVFACFLSFSFVPALAGLFLNRLSVSGDEKKIVAASERLYRRSLSSFIKRKMHAVLLMLACLAVGLIALFLLKTEFLPVQASDRVTATLEFEPGTSLAFMETTAREIMKKLSTESFVSDAFVSGGIDDNDFIVLSDPERKKEIVTVNILLGKNQGNVSRVKERLRSLLASERASVRVEEKVDLLSQVIGVRGARTVVAASDQNAAMIAASRMAGGNEALVYPVETANDYSFVPDRVANSRFGVSAMYTASVASSSLEGVESSPYYEKGIQIPVRVMLKEGYRDSIDKIGDVGVLLENGTKIPLRIFGAIERKENDKILYRHDRKDAKIVRLAGLPAAGLDGVEVIDLQSERIAEMVGNAGLLLAGIVFLLYLVMAAQFESFLIPAILLLALPPSFSGALVALLAFGATINVNSVISLVILFGISVSNSILLYEACMEEKSITIDGIVGSSVGKLRAILVTNVTTVVALIPFAIDPSGKSAQSSLSLAIIGGLVVSTGVVLYAVPTIFSGVLRGRKEQGIEPTKFQGETP